MIGLLCEAGMRTPADWDVTSRRGLEQLPAWKELYALTPAQVYPRGVELCCQGAPIEEVFYLEAGIVKQVHSDADGDETILELTFAGGWIGSTAAIVGQAGPVTATTCTRALLHRIPVEVFRDLLDRDQSLSRRIQEEHARGLCRQIERMAELSSRSSRERLVRIIRDLIVALGVTASPRGIRLQLPLRQWEIARLIAVTPEHLSRLLRQMQCEGLLRREKGWLVVTDLDRLGQPTLAAGRAATPRRIDLRQVRL